MTHTQVRLLRTTLAAAVLAVSITAAERHALALQGGEDPALLPVLVDKRFGAAGRHQLSLFFSTAMVTKFVDAIGPYATYTYNFSDMLGVELGGGYFFGSEAAVMEQVRAKVPGREPELSDLYQEQWMTDVALMFVPIYGKMSFASELDPSFDLFLVLGGGLAGLRRQIGDSALGSVTFDSKVAPAFNFGGGFRFYVTKLVAIRLELRDYFYPEQGTNLGGLTFNLHFQGGLQFNFGGGS